MTVAFIEDWLALKVAESVNAKAVICVADERTVGARRGYVGAVGGFVVVVDRAGADGGGDVAAAVERD